MSFRSEWREVALLPWLTCGGSPGSRSVGVGEQRRGQYPSQISHRKDTASLSI